tara:strand:+ start:4458 stop:4775 length:318 start_codon:yes stop_codon:yes gene_type:complete
MTDRIDRLLIKGQKPGGNDYGGRIPAEAGSLFNLKDDLGESSNVAAQNPEKAQQLQRLMEGYMTDFDAHKRPIGWMEGYSEERAIATKKAQNEAKAAAKAAKNVK